MTWKPIVVGVDGSPESLEAAKLGWRIARAAGVTCHYVYALPGLWTGGVEPLLYPPHIVERLTADVRNRVAEALRAEDPGMAREPLLARPGRPGVVLAQVAEERGAELVVVGGRTHGAVARVLGGSTAHYLVRTLPIPVLVTGPGARPPRRVLAAADLSEAAKPTLALAERYAGVLGARLRAMAVVEPAKFPLVIPLQLDEAEYARRCQAAFEALRPPPDHVLRHGVAVEAIAAEVANWGADLVVVGSHGKGWVERALIGSTTERLLNLLPVSVLVVPILRPGSRRARRARRARRSRRRPNQVGGSVIV